MFDDDHDEPVAGEHTVQLDFLSRLDAELAAITDLDTMLERLLTRARQFLNADAGTVYVRKGEALHFASAQCRTLEKQLKPGERLIHRAFTLPIDSTSMAGFVASRGQALPIADAYDLPPDVPYRHSRDFDERTGYRTRSILTVPIKTVTGEIIGAIQLINRLGIDGNPQPFSSEDVLSLEHFALRAAMTLYQARLTRTLAERMIKMAELRDPAETGPHANRVAALSRELYLAWAAHQRIAPKVRDLEADTLRTAAMLHDVGKVGIPDAILRKPGKLTQEEFAAMQQHTLIGGRLFEPCESELDLVAAEIARNHHECWDGNGYPGHLDPATGQPTGIGKRGGEIPVFAQIVSVIDVYDALRSERTYKRAWTHEEAMAEIARLGGTKYSPLLVSLFAGIEPAIHAVRARFPEA